MFGKALKAWQIVSFLLVGVLFIAISCFCLSLPESEEYDANGVISALEPFVNTEGETEYKVYVYYTDKDGVLHENVEYSGYDSFMDVGDSVELSYDPEHPEQAFPRGRGAIIYVFLALGVALTAFSLYKIISGTKKNKEKARGKTFDPELVRRVQNDDSPAREYYFHWTGKLNQSYVLETHEREAVFEAVCDHIGVLTPFKFTFINQRTGKSEEHTVSHTLTTRNGFGGENMTFSEVGSSNFKIDGVNNWEYLSRLGYSVEMKHSGLKLNFDVLKYGVPVAFLEAAGVNILKDGAKNPLGDKLPAGGLFKASCKDADIEGVFFACFCVSRVEFY